MSFLDDEDNQQPAWAPAVQKANNPLPQLTQPQVAAPLVPAADFDLNVANQGQRLEAQRLSGIGSRKGSVFDLETVVQRLYERVDNILSNVSGRDELEIAAAGELRQVARLAKDVMKDAAYINGIKKKHEEEIQVIVAAMAAVSPQLAKQVQEKLAELKNARRDFGGQ